MLKTDRQTDKQRTTHTHSELLMISYLFLISGMFSAGSQFKCTVSWVSYLSDEIVKWQFAK